MQGLSDVADINADVFNKRLQQAARIFKRKWYLTLKVLLYLSQESHTFIGKHIDYRDDVDITVEDLY